MESQYSSSPEVLWSPSLHKFTPLHPNSAAPISKPKPVRNSTSLKSLTFFLLLLLLLCTATASLSFSKITRQSAKVKWRNSSARTTSFSCSCTLKDFKPTGLGLLLLFGGPPSQESITTHFMLTFLCLVATSCPRSALMSAKASALR